MQTQKVRKLIAEENYRAVLCHAKKLRIGIRKRHRILMARAGRAIMAGIIKGGK